MGEKCEWWDSGWCYHKDGSDKGCVGIETDKCPVLNKGAQVGESKEVEPLDVDRWYKTLVLGMTVCGLPTLQEGIQNIKMHLTSYMAYSEIPKAVMELDQLERILVSNHLMIDDESEVTPKMVKEWYKLVYGE